MHYRRFWHCDDHRSDFQERANTSAARSRRVCRSLWKRCSQRASKLPRIEIVKPREVVGRNTVNSIQAGIFYGYVGLVDGIVKRIQKEESGVQAKVVATGGLAPLVAIGMFHDQRG